VSVLVCSVTLLSDSDSSFIFVFGSQLGSCVLCSGSVTD
jgi:hypothetical protein